MLKNTPDNVPRTPPAPRRRTRTRQPVGDENVGADPPSPMRTRRRRYQVPPTPNLVPEEVPVAHTRPEHTPPGTIIC